MVSRRGMPLCSSPTTLAVLTRSFRSSRVQVISGLPGYTRTSTNSFSARLLPLSSISTHPIMHVLELTTSASEDIPLLPLGSHSNLHIFFIGLRPLLYHY